MLHHSRRTPKQQNDFNIGNRFHQLGDLRKSAAAYTRYIERYPLDKAGHYNFAVTLAARDQADAAMRSYRRALEIDPWYPEALNNLGVLLHTQGRVEEAKACYARALAGRPDYEDAEYNFAAAESDCGNPQNAVLHLSRLLKRNPKRADAWNNLGNALLALNAPADALEAFRLARSLQPTLPDVTWNAASAELMLGHFPQGWEGFEQQHKLRHTSLPRWDGSEIKGKTILVHAEQGFGDTIQFIRYCSQVKRVSGALVVLECHPELVHLLRGVDGIDQFIEFNTALPPVDYQIPLMSLPLVFRTTLETIPNCAPYLNVETSLLQKWRAKLGPTERGLKIGLVWSGNPAHRNDRNRSINPALLEALAECKDVAFYCLQQKPQSAAVAQLLPSLPLQGVFDELTFPDTAALLLNLDLVVSVDTAVAHLAGALGKPVWTLLPFAADWRWMLHRSDTPWYPTMRLFRQPRLNDWTSVLQQVAAEIASLTPAHQMV